MKKNSPTNDFIKKAQKIHENKYDYSLVEYKNCDTKIKIICLKHNVFIQKPRVHLRGSGCKQCYNDCLKKSLFNFIKEATKIHKNKYDYSLVEYKNNKTKIIIICPIHGKFTQIPSNHINKGYGCNKCAHGIKAQKLKFSLKDFIKNAKKVHGNKYDYSLVEYKCCDIKVKIICPKHGVFKQTSFSHINVGYGCSKCSNNVSTPEKKWINKIEKEKGIILEKQYPIKINNKKYIVDGFHYKTKTIYEFLGDFWHGNPEKYNENDINPRTKTTYGFLYKKTLNKINNLKNIGYNVVFVWEKDFKKYSI